MTDRQFEVETMYAAGKEWLRTWDRESPRFRRIEDFGGLLFEANNAAIVLRMKLLRVCPGATGTMLDEVITRLLGDFPAEKSGLFNEPSPGEGLTVV